MCMKKAIPIGLLMLVAVVLSYATAPKTNIKLIKANVTCCAKWGGCHSSSTNDMVVPQITIDEGVKDVTINQDADVGSNYATTVIGDNSNSSGGDSNDKVPDDVGWRSANLLPNKAIIVGT